VALDSDTSWFNNPQYRIIVSKGTPIYVSVTPYGSEPENSPVVAFDIVCVSKQSGHSGQQHLWDCAFVNVVATEKVYTNGRAKGQEASVWNVFLEPRQVYYIVPHTMRRGVTGKLSTIVWRLRYGWEVEGYLAGRVGYGAITSLIVPIIRFRWS